jgi:hypothetical protein
MELFFTAWQVLNFGGKFIEDLDTHIMDSLLEFSYPCWWRVQVGFLASAEVVYSRISWELLEIPHHKHCQRQNVLWMEGEDV